MIKSIYHEHKGRYGYRRIHLELKNQVDRRLAGTKNKNGSKRYGLVAKQKSYTHYRFHAESYFPIFILRKLSNSKVSPDSITYYPDS
ncbi:IS3 family transposase [Vibrio splendidus]|uniref:IS3 family transposase n=1 Tax=Vibrio splendidus TaxID=29497 RepID=UPI003CE47FCD